DRLASRRARQRRRLLRSGRAAIGGAQRPAPTLAARLVGIRSRRSLRLPVHQSMRRAPGSWAGLLALAAVALGGVLLAHAQSGDVRIDISSGGHRIPIRCESFQTAGDRTARESSVIADTVLAHDLENAGVFDVTRGWTGTPPGAVQAVVGGTWSVTGNQLRLQGEVHDMPLRRPI